MLREPDKAKAITTKEIKGKAIKTIPVGTKFTVTYIHKDWACCQGLGISQIWNSEYELDLEL